MALSSTVQVAFNLWDQQSCVFTPGARTLIPTKSVRSIPARPCPRPLVRVLLHAVFSLMLILCYRIGETTPSFMVFRMFLLFLANVTTSAWGTKNFLEQHEKYCLVPYQVHA